MNDKSRLLLIIASLLLIVAYFTPIWKISLNAPQYPEGIGLKIHINTISGEKPNDLHNINNLNHYIGMKKIIPDSIPELKVMPFLFGFFILFGLVAAVSKKRSLLMIWVGLFIIVALVGLIDFYLWEYDYGHNLNPEAAIKVPGMSYQPPLIGTKQLLNMKTSSFPYIGGFAVLVSLSIGISLLFSNKPVTKAQVKSQKQSSAKLSAKQALV